MSLILSDNFSFLPDHRCSVYTQIELFVSGGILVGEQNILNIGLLFLWRYVYTVYWQ